MLGLSGAKEVCAMSERDEGVSELVYVVEEIDGISSYACAEKSGR